MEIQTHTLSSFDLHPIPPYSVTDLPDFRPGMEVCDNESAAVDVGGVVVDVFLPKAADDAVSATNGGGARCHTYAATKLHKVFENESAVDVGGGGVVFSPPKAADDAVSAANGGGARFHSDAAAMKLQKVYRSYRTRRLLADSAVVAEELWWQAIDYARLNRSTISFFNFLKPETAISRWNRISLNASKVGQGLSVDAKAQKLAFQHWIEAIDPRHRYGHSLHKYYEEWCKADSGQPFFYWLDIGDGKDVDLEECPRSKLRQQCIKYLGPHERDYYEYVVVKGEIFHKQTGDLLDTKGLPGSKWIFVMSTTKRLYAGEKKKGAFHHSSFLAGGAALAAGRLVAESGIIKSISAYSGHYRPTDERLDCLLSFLAEHGVELGKVEIRKSNEDYEDAEDSKSNKDRTKPVISTSSDSQESDAINEEEKGDSEAAHEASQNETKISYRRTLSGGLKSPRAEVPQTAILKRIDSKKKTRSYQLGNQLSLKWTTGVGPRIGCMADYPKEVRLQALDFTRLSPRGSSTPSGYRRHAGLASPQANNGGHLPLWSVVPM